MFFEQKRGKTQTLPRVAPGCSRTLRSTGQMKSIFCFFIGQKRSYPISFRGSEKWFCVFQFQDCKEWFFFVCMKTLAKSFCRHNETSLKKWPLNLLAAFRSQSYKTYFMMTRQNVPYNYLMAYGSSIAINIFYMIYIIGSQQVGRDSLLGRQNLCFSTIIVMYGSQTTKRWETTDLYWRNTSAYIFWTKPLL